jgi:hypothetical protein
LERSAEWAESLRVVVSAPILPAIVGAALSFVGGGSEVDMLVGAANAQAW